MIPEELQRHRHWVNWKMVDRGGKATKVPVRPDGGPASSSDASTWCNFDELNPSWSPGFVFSPDDPYVGIDLDGCREPGTGDLDEWAQEVIDQFQTYTEVSPSGTGVKLFGVADGFWKHKNKTELDGDGHGGKSPGIEVYDQKRYFAVTGKRIGSWEINPVDDALDWLAERFKMHKAAPTVSGAGLTLETPLIERASKYLAKMDPSISGSRGHDACFKAACALVLGFGLSTDEAYHLLATEFNRRCDPPWSEKELLHKVNSANQEPGQRGYLRDARPDQWEKIVVRTPKRTPRLDDQTVAVKTVTLERAAVEYLDDLRSGKTFLYETGIPDLDKRIGGFAPGEMVVIAARPSHGKSAISLQMVHHFTACGHAAVMLSEEMSAMAVGKRAIQFATDVPEYDWVHRSNKVQQDLADHFSTRAEARIIESCGTVDQACQRLESVADECDAKLVVVDYLQLLRSKGGNRYEQVTAASQELRKLASRNKFVLVVLAQLSREIEKRDSFIPKSSDLRESGQIEQDADVVLFGVWPHRVDAKNPEGDYQFFVEKNRNRGGAKTAFQVTFEPDRQRYLERALEVERHSEFDSWA